MGEDRLTGLALLHTKYNMPLDLGAIIFAGQHPRRHHAVITCSTSNKKVIFVFFITVYY